METGKRLARQQRLAMSALSPWLSDTMKRSVSQSDEMPGDLSPSVGARYLSDLSDELGGVISLSGGTIGDMLPPEFVREAARDAVDAYPHYPGIKGYRDVRVAMARK